MVFAIVYFPPKIFEVTNPGLNPGRHERRTKHDDGRWNDVGNGNWLADHCGCRGAPDCRVGQIRILPLRKVRLTPVSRDWGDCAAAVWLGAVSGDP